MELLQLKYFKTVADTGKISAAAEALFISAPALSTSISRLEKELGFPLFDRTHNAVILNRQGQIFLRYVNQVFATLDCARMELRQSMLLQGQHVSVATLSANVWVDLIAAFSQEYPQFTLSCTSLRLSQFEAGGLGHQYSFLLADELPPALQGELDSIPLFSDQVAVMVHPEHPFVGEASVSVSRLAGENLFMPMQDYPLHERLMGILEAEGSVLPTGNAYSSMICRHMVAENLGVSFSTCYTGRIAPEGLRYVPLETAEGPWTVRLCWRKNRKRTADEETFRSFVEAFYRHKRSQHKV